MNYIPTTKQQNILLYFMFFGAIIVAFSQQPTMKVISVQDKRDGNFASLSSTEIFFSFENLDTTIFSRYYIKEITSAKNNLGTELEQSVPSLLRGYYYSKPRFKLYLSSPDREAEKINSVQGVFSMINPSLEKGTLILVDDLTKKYNQNLLSNNSFDLQVQLMDSLSAIAFIAHNKNATKYGSRNSKKNETPTLVNEVVDGMVNGVANMLNDFLSSIESNNNSKHHIEFSYSDPNNVLLSLMLIDENGKVMDEVSTDPWYNFMTLYTDRELTPNCKLAILIKDENSITEYPFHLKNIYLP